MVKASLAFLISGNNVKVIHGWSDEIIPVENSIKLAKSTDCTLHLISRDHRLNSAIGVVEKLFSQFIANYRTTPVCCNRPI